MIDVPSPATEGRSVARWFAVFGLALLIATTVLWPVDATHYRVWVGDPVEDEPLAAETLDARELSPRVREDIARQLNGTRYVDGGFPGDVRTIREVRSHEYLRYDGAYYRYETSLGCLGCHRALIALLRTYALAVAATALAVAGFAARDDDPRPLTPRRALVIPVAALGALALAHAHDWVLGGPGQVLPTETMAGPFVLAATPFAAVGVLLRRRSWPAAVALVGATVLALAALNSGSPLPSPGTLVSSVGPVFVLGPLFAVIGAYAARRTPNTAPERTP